MRALTVLMLLALAAIPAGVAVRGFIADHNGQVREAVGSYVVRGNDPPESIRRSVYDNVTPEYGDWKPPLAAWIRAAAVRRPGSAE
jgi:hypothetical protein